MADPFVDSDQVPISQQDLIDMGLAPMADDDQPAELTLDTFRSELDSTVTNPEFLDKSYAEAEDALDQLYLGPAKDGSKQWASEEEEEKVRQLYKESAAALREYHGVLISPQDYIGSKISPPPNIGEALNEDEAGAMLDQWEGQSIAKLKTDYAADYLKYGDVIEQQIASAVDETKKRFQSQKENPEPIDLESTAGRLKLLPGQAKVFTKAIAEPMAEAAGWLADSFGAAPEGTGESWRRAIATSKYLTEPPELMAREKDAEGNDVDPLTKAGYGKVVVDVFGTKVPIENISQGLGTTTGIVGTSLVAGAAAAPFVSAGAANAAAALAGMSLAGRMGYHDGYSKVFEKTQNQEQAVKSAWLNAGVEAADSAFDLAIARGLVPYLGKAVSKTIKIDVLTKLVMDNQFGRYLKTGLSIGTAAVASGASEVAQEVTQGVGTAAITGDESFLPTAEGIATAGFVGAAGGVGTGVIGEGSAQGQFNNQIAAQTTDILQQAGVGLNDVLGKDTAEESNSNDDDDGGGGGGTPFTPPAEPGRDKGLTAGSDERAIQRRQGELDSVEQQIAEIEKNRDNTKNTGPQNDRWVQLQIERDRLRTIINSSKKATTASAETKLPDVKTTDESTIGSERIPVEDPKLQNLSPDASLEKINTAIEQSRSEQGLTNTGEDVTILGKPYTFERRTLDPKSIVSQKDIPNVKIDVDPETGVTRKMGSLGRFSHAKSGNIIVLEKDVTAGGELEVLSGRNRWHEALEQGIKGISSYVVKESDGFTIHDAHALDAELNIADNQGETIDYATFFRENPISYETAKEHGILRNKRGAGMRGFVLGSQSTAPLWGAYKNRRISEDHAVAIAHAAPNDERLQQEGINLAPRFSPEIVARALEGYKADGRIPPNERTGPEIPDKNKATYVDRAQASLELQKEAEDKRTELKNAAKAGGETGKTHLGVEFKNLPPAALKQKLIELNDRIDKLDPGEYMKDPAIRAEVEARGQEIADRNRAERAEKRKTEGEQIGLSFLEGGAAPVRTTPAPAAAPVAPVSEFAPPAEPADDQPSLFAAPTAELPHGPPENLTEKELNDILASANKRVNDAHTLSHSPSKDQIDEIYGSLLPYAKERRLRTAAESSWSGGSTEGQEAFQQRYGVSLEDVRKRKTKKSQAERQQAPGISAAERSDFPESQTLDNYRQAIERARAAGVEGPVSDEQAEELLAGPEGGPSDYGQYYSTTQAEQKFFADRFLAGKNLEEVANQIVDPEQDPLAEVDPVTRDVVVAKVKKHIDNEEILARARGDIKRATELKNLSLGLLIEYKNLGTSQGQAQAIRKAANAELGISPTGAEIVHDIENNLSFGEKTSEVVNPEILKTAVEVYQEQENLSQQELDLKNQQAEINNQQTENIRLAEKIKETTANISDRQSEFEAAKKELSNERKTLADQVKGLEKEENRLNKKYNQAIAKQEAKIRELESKAKDAEGRIDEARKKLARMQDEFKANVAKIKADMKGLRQIEKDLLRRQKALSKKELKLRQARAQAREKFVFESLPSSVQGRIKEMIGRLEATPIEHPFIRQEIANQIYKEVLKNTNMSPVEVLLTVWYGNELSGLSTQGINNSSSGVVLTVRSLPILAKNPETILPFFSEVLRSFGRNSHARNEAGSILLEGRGTRASIESKYNFQRGLEILQPTSTLEALIKEGASAAGSVLKNNPAREFFTGFGVAKFLTRLIRAGDAFWFNTAKDARIAGLMAIQGKKLGQTSEEIATNISQALYGTLTQTQEATKQAEEQLKTSFGEGEYSQRDIVRATFEILSTNLDPDVAAEGNRWGSMTTLTQAPEGTFGTFAGLANDLLSKAVIPTRWGNIPLAQPFIPFVNIVANLGETGIEFSPLGLAKAAAYPSATDAQKARKAEIITNAIFASTAAAALVAIAAHFSDDDDPPFMIYGSGDPLTKEEKQSLMNSSDWRPFTFKVGSVYIPYKETPFFWMSAFGAYFDNKRWNQNFDRKVGTNYIKFMIGGVGQAFFDNTIARSMADAVDLIRGKKDPVDFTANYSGGFLPVVGLARDMDRIFNAQFQEVIVPDRMLSGEFKDQPVLGSAAQVAAQFTGALFKNYPVVGGMINKPMLNGFGEPITPVLEERFGFLRRTIGTFRKDDAGPEWKFLAQHGLTFAGYKETIQVGKGGNSAAGQAKNRNYRKKRDELIARAYSNIFTPEERYDLVKETGPKIKAAITHIMSTSGVDTMDRLELQEKVDKSVTKAKTEGKISFISRRLNKMNSASQ